MAVEDQREDLVREQNDHLPSREDCDRPNEETEVSAKENEAEGSFSDATAEEDDTEQSFDLQPEDPSLHAEQTEEQLPPSNGEQAPTEPTIKTGWHGGIVLKPLHLLIGSFFIVALVTGSILFGMWLVSRDHGPKIEENVKDYDDIYASAADIAAGNFAAPGYTEITLPAERRDVQIILPNPKGNPCFFRYTLVLKDTGEVLYQTGLIEPGKAVTEIRLSRPLETGDYVLELQIEATSIIDQSAMNGINIGVVLKVR